MNINENECTVTISQKRYAELVIAEKDAERMKAIICKSANDYHTLTVQELKVMRNMLMPQEEEV